MQERIDKELALLRRSYPDLEYRAEGRWIRVPAYPLPPGWSFQTTDVAFDIPPEFPGGPPYGIYLPAGLTVNGQRPDNYAEPASKQPPFEGTWGVLSWTTLDGKASRQNNMAIIRDWCYPRIQYWRGRPLVSLEVVVNLIGHTTTRSGLAIRSELDANNYPTGQPVTAQQMESISLKRDKFHGDWNYSLAPK